MSDMGLNGIKSLSGLVLMAVVLLTLGACGGEDSPTPITVEEAAARGYQRGEEPCLYRAIPEFQELYRNVPYERLGGGQCAFYYPPNQ